MAEINNRIDFVYLFDVQDGNPNGDPDAGNLPRVDAETGMGLVTDVCLKRKVRNYVQVAKDLSDGYDIFIKEKAVLNSEIDKAHDDEDVKKAKDKTAAARLFMCKNYYDIRTFGAVMSTGKNAGQVRGPIQFTFARSIDPIATAEHSITRMAVATEKEAEKQNGDNRTMGRKATVPYGLYVCHGFISASLAKQTGFSEEDLELFFEALKNHVRRGPFCCTWTDERTETHRVPSRFGSWQCSSQQIVRLGENQEEYGSRTKIVQRLCCFDRQGLCS